MFGKLKEKLKRVLGRIEEEKAVEKGEEIRKGEKKVRVDEGKLQSILDELELALIESDVAVSTASEIRKMIYEKIVQNPPKGDLRKAVREALEGVLLSILEMPGELDLFSVIDRAKAAKGYALLLFLGFNGVGKTLTLAKIAYLLKQRGYRCLLAAGDTFRAAAIEQLEEHAKKLGMELVKQEYGSDACAVIYDARIKAQTKGFDVVLADTAGRSHASKNLMEELKKIVRVNSPDLKILVLDALTGNDILEQTRRFDDAVGVDAIVLTKFDVYEKGGAAISACHAIKKPILFLGVGQAYEDLLPFDPQRIVRSLFES